MRSSKLTIAILLTLACTLIGGAQTRRPELKITSDGFPTGHGSPEGAACDLARAYINRNAALFQSVCIKPFGSGDGRKKYESFLKQAVKTIKDDAKKATPAPRGPKSIGIVFASRRLSKSGPASYAYAAYSFKEIQFVDVGVFLRDGGNQMTRTLVIQTSDGKWYVHPMPDSAPLLSTGLNKEPMSTRTIKDVYTLVR